MSDDSQRTARARARARWPGGKYKLGGEPEVSLLESTTIEQRVAMVQRLTYDAWALAGLAVPAYARSEAPGQIVRKS